MSTLGQSLPSKPNLLNPKNLVRTKNGCYEITYSPYWGTCLVPVNDPMAMEIDAKDLTEIKLVDNFPKVPSELWAPWVKLAFDLSKTLKREYEVSVVLLRNELDPNQWKIVVPYQIVSSVSVEADFEQCVDLVTGEEYDEFPPVGWVHAGSSHSHNSMSAFFSSTDDKYELGVPGLHIVIGKIDHKHMTYELKASIVQRRCRKMLDFNLVVDTTPKHIDYHPKCLDMIYSYVNPKTPKTSKSNFELDLDWWVPQ